MWFRTKIIPNRPFFYATTRWERRTVCISLFYLGLYLSPPWKKKEPEEVILSSEEVISLVGRLTCDVSQQIRITFDKGSEKKKKLPSTFISIPHGISYFVTCRKYSMLFYRASSYDGCLFWAWVTGKTYESCEKIFIMKTS